MFKNPQYSHSDPSLSGGDGQEFELVVDRHRRRLVREAMLDVLQ